MSGDRYITHKASISEAVLVPLTKP